MAVAAAAGLVSFLSPCVLPLVPGYLSYVTGLAGADLDAAAQPARTRGAALLPLRPAARAYSGRGRHARVHRRVRRRVRDRRRGVQRRRPGPGDQRPHHRDRRGALTVLLGVGYLGAFPLLQRQVRATRLPSAGLASAPVLGATFGLSWTPCVSPPSVRYSGWPRWNPPPPGPRPRAGLLHRSGPAVPARRPRLRRADRHPLRAPPPPVGHPRGRALLVAIGLALLTGAWVA
ncbi:cytochrome c biogenesis protein CcdA [Micromonospora sp. M12]